MDRDLANEAKRDPRADKALHLSMAQDLMSLTAKVLRLKTRVDVGAALPSRWEIIRLLVCTPDFGAVMSQSRLAGPRKFAAVN